MERAQILHSLRIAAATVCLVLCAAFVVLWVRSYTYRINLQTLPFANRTFQCSLLPGRMHFRTHRLDPQWISGFWQMHKSDPGFDDWDYPNSPTFKFSINEYGPGDITVHFPYLFPALVTGAFAAAFGIRHCWRFSLRTMLLVTTFVAVLLGMIAVAIR